MFPNIRISPQNWWSHFSFLWIFKGVHSMQEFLYGQMIWSNVCSLQVVDPFNFRSLSPGLRAMNARLGVAAIKEQTHLWNNRQFYFKPDNTVTPRLRIFWPHPCSLKENATRIEQCVLPQHSSSNTVNHFTSLWVINQLFSRVWTFIRRHD